MYCLTCGAELTVLSVPSHVPPPPHAALLKKTDHAKHFDVLEKHSQEEHIYYADWRISSNMETDFIRWLDGFVGEGVGDDGNPVAVTQSGLFTREDFPYIYPLTHRLRHATQSSPFIPELRKDSDPLSAMLGVFKERIGAALEEASDKFRWKKGLEVAARNHLLPGQWEKEKEFMHVMTPLVIMTYSEAVERLLRKETEKIEKMSIGEAIQNINDLCLVPFRIKCVLYHGIVFPDLAQRLNGLGIVAPVPAAEDSAMQKLKRDHDEAMWTEAARLSITHKNPLPPEQETKERGRKQRSVNGIITRRPL